MKRPGIALWLYFQFGGKLPATYRDWVLHNATCRTWLARALLRTELMLLPIFVALFFVLASFGSSGIALASVLLGVLVSLRIAATNVTESVDARLVRYGFPPGHASATRKAMAAERRAEEQRRYRERWGRPPE